MTSKVGVYSLGVCGIAMDDRTVPRQQQHEPVVYGKPLQWNCNLRGLLFYFAIPLLFATSACLFGATYLAFHDTAVGVFLRILAQGFWPLLTVQFNVMRTIATILLQQSVVYIMSPPGLLMLISFIVHA